MNPIRVCILFLSAAAASPVATASAQSDQRPHGPPPAAFDACNGKSSGDSCTVTFGERTVDGSCRQLPQDDRLACMPDHMPGPPPDRR